MWNGRRQVDAGSTMKCSVFLGVVLFLWTAQAAKKESCERCELVESCPFFAALKSEDQKNWRDRFNCDESSTKSSHIYGFSSSAKGDLVCCPENVWNVDNPSQPIQERGGNNEGTSSTDNPVKMEKNSFIYQPNYSGYPISSGYPNVNGGFGGSNPGNNWNNGAAGNPGNNWNNGMAGNQNSNPTYSNQNGHLSSNQYGNTNGNIPYGNGNKQNGYEVYESNNDNRGGAFSGHGSNNGNALNGDQFDNRNENPRNENSDEDYSGEYDAQRIPSWSNRRRGKRPDNKAQNPYFLPANRKDNSFRGTNLGGQCPVTSFPPNPDTGCCGLEATNSDRINAAANNPGYTQSGWQPHANVPSSGYRPPWLPYSDRVKREDVNVTFDNRIAGGKETELEQFPWTVLLKTVFQYPTKDVAFSCGGSLISSRYVVTAGHCIFDSKGTVKDVEVFLAEYDKRTFPRDCKNVLGKGEVCVENIVMHAEKLHLHPEYDDNRLNNDIALIRLRGNAPYTDYIRPICLPPINVDSPQLSNLRLAVAGWGRNGQYKSNIKQSTVVNLVPQTDCRNSYPALTRLQVCAAGYTGEDTCKGDSGGPLMMMYGGKYFVSGVVSGKRADAPCGTSVPSLYTNVYQYLPWIRSVITN